MAKAKRVTRTIKRTVKKSVPGVNLELGEGEADFLQAVMAMIGGSTENSPRKYAVRIARALEQATGQKYTDTDAYKLLRSDSHTIGFQNYSPSKDAGSWLDREQWTRANPSLGTWLRVPGTSYGVYDDIDFR